MRRLFAALFVLCFATPALAAWSGKWAIDKTQSSIRFTGTQEGADFSGKFGDFTASIAFDPAHPANGRISVTIPLASVSVEGKDRQDAIGEKEWFDVKTFPKARFTSNEIVRDEKNKGGFIAKGRLTIKGVGQPVALPFTLTTTGDVTRADGSFVLKRNDFGIGSGEFASDAWIKHEVKVAIVIVAKKK